MADVGLGQKLFFDFSAQTGVKVDALKGEEISIEQAGAMLRAQHPAHEQLINELVQQACKPPPPDAKKGVRILDARVKTTNEAVQAPTPPPVYRVDPYYVTFEIPRDAGHVLTFNNRNINRDGFAALMGQSSREGLNPGLVDTSQIFKPEGTVVEQRTIGKGAEYARFEEANAPEFRPGDGTTLVALRPDGEFHSLDQLTSPTNETTTITYPGKREGNAWVADKTKPPIARQTTKGDRLDNTPANHFKDRLSVEFRFADTYSPKDWINAPLKPEDVELAVMFKKGFIFEPEAWAQASVAAFGAQARTEVRGENAKPEWIPKQGLRYPGSPTRAVTGKPTNNLTWRTLFTGQALDLQTGTADPKTDKTQEYMYLGMFLPPELDTLQMAGVAAGKREGGSLLGDLSIGLIHTGENQYDKMAERRVHVEKRPASEAARSAPGSERAQEINLTLQEGFIELGQGSLKGYKIEYGLTDQQSWTPLGRLKLGEGSASEKLDLKVVVRDPHTFEEHGGKIEVRLLGPTNFPVKRMMFSYAGIEWPKAMFE